MNFRKNFKTIFGATALILTLVAWAAVTARAAQQIDIVGQAGSGSFGAKTFLLPNGNIVVLDPDYDITTPSVIQNVGAVYLYDGETGALISMLTGSTANDHIGDTDSNTSDMGITILLGNNLANAGSNFLIHSPDWDNGTAQNAGALTFCSGTTGCSGAVSATNSLVGTKANDNVGLQNNDFGQFGGFFGSVFQLSNGNYLVGSPSWDRGAISNAGAITHCSGTMGCVGEINETNPVVGSTADDGAGNHGFFISGGTFVSPLTNGNYVLRILFWGSNDVGAVRFCNLSTPCVGEIDASNSLLGAGSITPLTNGNYVATGSGIQSFGSRTFCSGTTGCTGTVSAANSLVGSTTGDFDTGQVMALNNGNYVVTSPNWDNGAVVDAGAATFCSGTTGYAGTISPANSLVGSNSLDRVGGGLNSGSITQFSNSNFIVHSTDWRNGSATKAGAATFCSGTTGCPVGAVSAANSLIGTATDDEVGRLIKPLPNGNFVLGSPFWNNGTLANAGAATFCHGINGCPVGLITAANSLIGSSANDQVGDFNTSTTLDTVVGNSNYMLNSPGWNFGGNQDVGAITWCSGATGCVGTISVANSLIGIGDAGNNYSPFAATVVGTGSLTASVTDATLPGLDAAQSASRFWSLTETGDLTAGLSFTYTNGDVVGNESDYKVFRRSGGVNTPITPFALNAAANTAGVSGISSFSDWGVGSMSCPAITLSPASLPNAALNSPYSQTVLAGGGASPYTFTVTGGSLPSGLSLNPNTGEISGTPGSPGAFNFTVTATDANDCGGSREFSNFTVSAQYQFSWFYYSELLLSEQVLNQVTAGGNLPVRFTLYGYKGNPYSLPPTSEPISCSTFAATGAAQVIDRYAPDPYYSGLYDFYQTTWRTRTAWRFTCRRLTLHLTDGTTKSLKFYFK